MFGSYYFVQTGLARQPAPGAEVEIFSGSVDQILDRVLEIFQQHPDQDCVMMLVVEQLDQKLMKFVTGQAQYGRTWRIHCDRVDFPPVSDLEIYRQIDQYNFAANSMDLYYAYPRPEEFSLAEDGSCHVKIGKRDQGSESRHQGQEFTYQQMPTEEMFVAMKFKQLLFGTIIWNELSIKDRSQLKTVAEILDFEFTDQTTGLCWY